MKRILVACALLLTLAACGSQPTGPGAHPGIKGVKVGKPYDIEGQTYYPEYDPHYDRTGLASWYGPGFHGKKTANGEQFDQHDLTAAHPTLPMPSMVRVTNLENGKSEVIRINDRGPFKKGRLIDLSRASAEALGVQGLAKVRVQYLKEETEEYWADMSLGTQDIQFAANDPNAPGNAGKKMMNNYDGVIVPADEQVSQVKSSAPVMSVASSEIGQKPKDYAIKPKPLRFSVIGEAEASEEDYPAEEPAKPVKKVAEATAQPRVVQLYDSKGVAINLDEEKDDASEDRSAKVVRLTKSETPPAPKKKIASAGASSTVKNLADVKPGGRPPVDAVPPVTGRWFIQAGSFASEDNAQKLGGQLSGLGPVEVAAVEVSGRLWHRVRLGPFGSKGEAEERLDQAIDQGADGAHVTGQ